MSARIVVRFALLIVPWLVLIPLAYLGERAEALFWRIERWAPRA